MLGGKTAGAERCMHLRGLPDAERKSPVSTARRNGNVQRGTFARTFPNVGLMSGFSSRRGAEFEHFPPLLSRKIALSLLNLPRFLAEDRFPLFWKALEAGIPWTPNECRLKPLRFRGRFFPKPGRPSPAFAGACFLETLLSRPRAEGGRSAPRNPPVDSRTPGLRAGRPAGSRWRSSACRARSSGFPRMRSNPDR